MANTPGEHKPQWSKGQRLRAADLNRLMRAASRRVVGDGKTISVRAFGDQLIISRIG